ncbi:MAG: collagenase [bacterium]|nr:collagenase [bacterium]
MKQLKKENIIINYSESLEELSIKTIEILIEKASEYKVLFDVEDYEPIVANYFDNLDEFRKFIYDLRGEKDSLPEYARGTYDKGMINACVDSQKQMNRLYTASHELFHIWYMKYILKNDYSKRIVWYDEGMAQFFSGEKRRLDSEEKFKDYYFNVKESTKIIPNLNQIKHGNSFCNENYNGYDLSYLCIRYLSEIMSQENFKALMLDFNQIKMFGNNVINDMFEYYDKKIENKRVK